MMSTYSLEFVTEKMRESIDDVKADNEYQHWEENILPLIKRGVSVIGASGDNKGSITIIMIDETEGLHSKYKIKFAYVDGDEYTHLILGYYDEDGNPEVEWLY